MAMLNNQRVYISESQKVCICLQIWALFSRCQIRPPGYLPQLGPGASAVGKHGYLHHNYGYII